ncbi:BEL1-like homeodomain protein 7 [Aristolochia californica]|uniref:BEL1-like homeodomain protein 7 n=1 Tax=Aristolochia californica TaxID=171875 RepID=UPI0035D778FD
MATYYNSGNQRDVMPTLYLREPESTSYPESSSVPNNMVYMNYSSAGSHPDNIGGNSQSQPTCVDIPVHSAMLSQDPSQGTSESTQTHQGILSNLGYGVWRDGRNEMLFMQPSSNVQALDPQMHSAADTPMHMQTQLGIFHGGPNVSAIQGQGLSLSLGTQIPSALQMSSFQFRPGTTDISFVGLHQSTSGDRDDTTTRGEQPRHPDLLPAYSDQEMKGDVSNNLQNSTTLKQINSDPNQYALTSTIPNSKYLQAAQQLLDEVVNVRKALQQDRERHQNFMSVGMQGLKESDGGSKGGGSLPSSSGMSSNPQEASSNSMTDLSPAERQDLQNKLSKLLAMLDEVDQRYKQYFHQMQIVVSSFDIIAGAGAAKPYTALALQTISRHFRCLRDAINGQIRAARRSLGEQEGLNSKGSGGISRLRFVDQQLRQQRALQQIGMVQQHAWRPQRGLPESSVSILRAWLFEHFLHPYPKDSDKIMLARQTGLTRSQVSNWFINARVRLWKPMVEEMYKEEIGDVEMDSNSSSENASKGREQVGNSEDREDNHSMKSSAPENSQSTSQFNDTKSDHVSDVEMSVTTSVFHHSGGQEDHGYVNVKPRDMKPNTEDCSLLQDALLQREGNGRFMAYQMAELGRFGGGGVSLTLGLQHCDGGMTPVTAGQQNFVTMRGDSMYSSAAPVSPTDSDNFDCLNLANRQHRFGSSQLLHDFVA